MEFARPIERDQSPQTRHRQSPYPLELIFIRLRALHQLIAKTRRELGEQFIDNRLHFVVVDIAPTSIGSRNPLAELLQQRVQYVADIGRHEFPLAPLFQSQAVLREMLERTAHKLLEAAHVAVQFIVVREQFPRGFLVEFHLARKKFASLLGTQHVDRRELFFDRRQERAQSIEQRRAFHCLAFGVRERI